MTKPDFLSLIESLRMHDASVRIFVLHGTTEEQLEATTKRDEAYAKLVAAWDEMQERLERSLNLCSECGRGFVDDDWAKEKQVLQLQLSEALESETRLRTRLSETNMQLREALKA